MKRENSTLRLFIKNCFISFLLLLPNISFTQTCPVSVGPDQYAPFGTSITLTATGDGPFSWSTGQTSSSITVTAGVYTEYIVQAGGRSIPACYDTVAVGATLAFDDPGIATLDTSICYTQTVTLPSADNWYVSLTEPPVYPVTAVLIDDSSPLMPDSTATYFGYMRSSWRPR